MSIKLNFTSKKFHIFTEALPIIDMFEYSLAQLNISFDEITILTDFQL